MASAAIFVMERALSEGHFNKTRINGTWGTFAQVNATAKSNATNMLIKKLVFAESKSVRTSTIILAVFNVLAALATATSILYDSYVAGKRCNPKFKSVKWCVKRIHPAEIFPLLLAAGIAIQGLAFIGVQSTGLTSLFITNCSLIAQVMWPAIFIVPYVQLVFGIECAIRSLRAMPFQPRHKLTVPILGVVVLLMMIATWLPSHLLPNPDVCFASLFWFVTRYGNLGLTLLSIIAALMLASAITIFVRLSSSNLVDEDERIAASRMVYYLILGIISLAFVIPWFVSLETGNGDLKAAMMAAVVVNLSGLISGLLQLFLRANTTTTSFGPVASRDKKKHEIRLWGPNELMFSNHMTSPLSAPRTPVDVENPRTESRSKLVHQEKERVFSIGSLDSYYVTQSPTSRFNQQAHPAKSNDPSAVEPLHLQPKKYSLFPSEAENKLGANKRQEPTSIYDITDLQPPSQAFGRGHRRDSSLLSTATVQIGLRLSNAVCPNAAVPLPLPPTTYNPASAGKLTVPVPLQLQANTTLPARPSPLANSFSPKTASPKVFSPKTSSPTLSTINKTLPPTPKSEKSPETCQLSPAVYTPQASTPKSKTASLSRGPLGGNPLNSPVASKPAKKNQWI